MKNCNCDCNKENQVCDCCQNICNHYKGTDFEGLFNVVDKTIEKVVICKEQRETVYLSRDMTKPEVLVSEKTSRHLVFTDGTRSELI